MKLEFGAHHCSGTENRRKGRSVAMQLLQSPIGNGDEMRTNVVALLAVEKVMGETNPDTQATDSKR
jgi:hypothetical protein